MTYPGGKSGAGVYQQIINQIPPHALYIEPFLDGGSILKYKKPALASIAIDIDKDVIDRFVGAQGLRPDLHPDDRPIPGVTYLHDDAISYLATHTIPNDAFIYLDPPYLMSTRSCQRQMYRYEMSESTHIILLNIILDLNCNIAISGYSSGMYQTYLLDWRMITFPAMTRAGNQATECLWMNYPEPYELHDYRYLGENYRQRERIKRRQQRWFKRLSSMPALERYAMLSVVDQLRSNTAIPAVTARYDDDGPQELTRAATPITDDAGSNPDPRAESDDAPEHDHDHNCIFDGDRSFQVRTAIPSEERSTC